MSNRNRTLAILIAIVILLLIGMYTTSQTGEAGPIQNAVGIVLTPLQKGAYFSCPLCLGTACLLHRF